MINKIKKAISNLYRLDTVIAKENAVSVLRHTAISSKTKGITENTVLSKPIIVSLTTYGKKIYDVYLVIESIFCQTCKPNRIILWLDKEKFSDETIPYVLKSQVSRGLEIQYVSDDGPHTKLLPAYERFGYEAHIISIDDDIIYPVDMIERFVVEYNKNPDKVYFNKGHKILFDKKRNIQPYLSWVNSGIVDYCSLWNFPLGVYGVFYSSGVLHYEVSNRKLFRLICPKADDVWFKAMSLMTQTPCIYVEQGMLIGNNFVSIELNREEALARTNVDEGYNDTQIKDVFEKFNLNNILK